MKPRLHSLAFLLCWLAATGVVEAKPQPAREVQLGDARFAVTVRAPLTDWVESLGPRFETTAAVVSARLNGREYLTAQGLADEFNPKWIAPPGYNEARPGEPFLKIGIGNLERLDKYRYLFGRFPVRRLARNDSPRIGEADAAFRQEFDSGLGWAYVYEKSYHVDARRAVLEICYLLRNTGTKPILTEQYNHNWFALSAGGVCTVSGPFTARCVPGIPFDGLEVRPGRITVRGPVTQPSYATAVQYVRAWRNRLRVCDEATGRWVEVSGNFPVSRFALFAEVGAVCPEVYGQWEIAPGETAKWERRYRFGN